jgi:hypothetical protein
MGITIPTAARNAMCDALVDLVDGGTTDTTGDLVIMTSGDVEVATLSWTATPAFGASSAGVATMNAINDDTSATGGTAALHKFQDRDNVEIFRGNVATSGGDLNLSSLAIGATDTVSVSAYTVTVPAS